MRIISGVTGKTKLLGVIGNPLSHSISPQLHNTLSKHMNIDAVYVPFEVKKENLSDAIKGLRALNVAGFNVTIPYKNDVMEYIDEFSREAELIGAVNTVKNENGKLYGYNTDVSGFVRSFKEESGIDLKGKKAVLLGAGGASRAIAVGLAFEGVSRISIINRTISKAEQIANIINNNTLTVAECFCTNDLKVPEVLREGDIIINTTSLGMFPDIEGTPVNFPFEFTKGQVLYDVIYNPAKTRFLMEGEKQGLKTVNGLGMLIYQGIQAYEIWMDVKVPERLIKNLYRAFSEL